jgi:glycosyltransferase A (GT-A) superfamily protein (DUF2064 family)
MASVNAEVVGGAIVVVAKCPRSGHSKTRLVPLLGIEGAAALAEAMLSDVLVSLSDYLPLEGTLKVLLYAPGTKEGELHMISILQSLHLPFVVTMSQCCSTGSNDKGGEDDNALLLPLPILQTILTNNGWVLLPMKVSTSDSDLASSSLLGEILVDALDKTRALLASLSKCSNNSSVTPCTTSNNDAVLFLGMDSPELPLEEIVYGLQLSSGKRWIQHDDAVINGVHNGKAHLCPANDGGYGLLSIPKHAPSLQIFSRVRWSHPLTAVSQLKALTDCNVDVSIGTLMYDIDEPNDVHDLVTRLVQLNNSNTRLSPLKSDQISDPLTCLSAGINGGVTTEDIQPCLPRNTWKTLIELNLIKVDE